MWYALVWFGMVWYALVFFGMVLYDGFVVYCSAAQRGDWRLGSLHAEGKCASTSLLRIELAYCVIKNCTCILRSPPQG